MKSILTLFFLVAILGPCRSQTEMAKKSGNYGVTLSFPWVNQYRYVDYQLNENKSTFGFFGLGISGFYKNGKHKASVNLSIAEALASPAKINSASEKDLNTSIECSYLELIYHRTVRENVSVIGGFNLNNYKFRLTSKLNDVASYHKTDQTLGASLGIEYRFSKFYSVAGVYRPALASFEADETYRHLINLEFRVDLNFKEKK